MEKSKATCLEIAAIVSDLRAQAIGGFTSGIKLFEACVVPGLLYNGGTWTDMPRQAVTTLEGFLLWFIRLLLRIGPGALKAGLWVETGLLSMELRIWREKLLLARHIVTLDSSCYAKQVWGQQVLHGWPRLAKEVEQICGMLVLPSVGEWEGSSKESRAMVTQACQERDEAVLKKEMKGKQKAQKIINEGCRMKDYFKRKCLPDV
jgi:hypothetical protein